MTVNQKHNRILLISNLLLLLLIKSKTNLAIPISHHTILLSAVYLLIRPNIVALFVKLVIKVALVQDISEIHADNQIVL